MTLNDIVSLITQKKHSFQIRMEGKTFKRKTIEEVLSEYSSLCDYFNRTAAINRVGNLTIQLFAKNGSSWLDKGFFVVPVGAVELPNKKIEPSTKPLMDLPELAAHNNLGNVSPDIRLLQFMLNSEKERNEELKLRNKELERKNDALYTENSGLIRDNSTQKEKLELEYKGKELDLKNEQQNGLSGVMETVKELPPEAWSFLAGIFPNHPMNKALTNNNSNNNNAESVGKKKHSDEDAQVFLDIMWDSLLNQEPEVVAMFGMILEKLIQNPKAMKQIHAKLYPEAKTEKEENLN